MFQKTITATIASGKSLICSHELEVGLYHLPDHPLRGAGHSLWRKWTSSVGCQQLFPTLQQLPSLWIAHSEVGHLGASVDTNMSHCYPDHELRVCRVCLHTLLMRHGAVGGGGF